MVVVDSDTRYGEPYERWRSKRWIASHYGYKSTRWEERMVAFGMPSRMIGGQRRFRLSAVDKWLVEYAARMAA